MFSLCSMTAIAWMVSPSAILWAALLVFLAGGGWAPTPGAGPICGSALSGSVQVDALSEMMCLLIIINSWSGVLSVFTMQPEQSSTLCVLLVSLGAVCYLFFTQSSLMKLYVYFELSLVPIFLIVMGWGYQSERVLASKSMMIYTITCSLPLLLVILSLEALGTSASDQLGGTPWPGALGGLAAAVSLTAFLVKLPLMFLHMWLPKAHVEAPVLGSMFLAAVLLKLGGAGLAKLAALSEAETLMKPVFISVALWSLVIISLLCVQASDLKVLIAFSSVAHMALAVLALFSLSCSSYGSLGLVLLSHGGSSSMAFYFSFLLYQMTSSRSMLLNKSCAGVCGAMMVFWGVCVLGVMGAPPSFNLWAEMMTIFSTMVLSAYFMKFFFFGAFLTGAYSFVLVSSSLNFNSQFFSSSKLCGKSTDKVHLFFSLAGLVFLVVLSPLFF